MKEFLAEELSRKKILEIQLTGKSRTSENIGIDTNFYDTIAKRIILTPLQVKADVCRLEALREELAKRLG